MKVKLFRRHYGIHTLVKETEVEGTLRRYVKRNSEVDPAAGETFAVQEERLISALPNDFLPVDPSKILLTIQDKGKMGSTAQVGLSQFRNWAKYFDAFCIELCR